MNHKSLKLITKLVVALLLVCPVFSLNQNVDYSSSTYENYNNCKLPDLTSSDPFAGQAYKGSSYWQGLFFGDDGTFVMRSRFGNSNESDYSLQQWKKTAIGTYTYNPSSRLLVLKVSGIYDDFGRLINNASDYADSWFHSLSQQWAKDGYDSVMITKKFIDYFSSTGLSMLRETVLKCSIENGRLVLEADGLEKDKYDYGVFEYNKDDLNIKFFITYNEQKIILTKGKDSISTALISPYSDGIYDFNGITWEIANEKKKGIVFEVGDFDGKCEYDYGSYYFKLSSVTGNIPESIKELVGKEFQLSKIASEILYPITKTINYTIIGSDGKKALDTHTYITDSSLTKWTNDTLQLISKDCYEGIYSNMDCTRSVIGKEIREGTPVYVKLKKITASQYNEIFSNFSFNNEAECAKIDILSKDEFTVSFETACENTIGNQIVKAGNKIERPQYFDGTFLGTARGRNNNISVKVNIAGGKLSSIVVAQQEETEEVASIAIEKIPIAIVNAQSTEVDVVSGATMTSKAIMQATTNALNSAAIGKTDSVFCGWYKDSNSMEQFDFSTHVVEDVTLYARWIEQDLNVGGSGIGTKIGKFHSDIIYLPSGTNGTAGTKATYCYFGDFPQTIKAVEVVVDESNSIQMGAYTYYEGSDGCYYVKCYENPYRDYYYSNGTKIGQSKEAGFYTLETITLSGVTLTAKEINDLYVSSGLDIPEFMLILNKDDTGKMTVDENHYNLTWNSVDKTIAIDGILVPCFFEDNRISLFFKGSIEELVFKREPEQLSVGMNDDEEAKFEYFRVEPIKWRVLTDNYNGTGKKLLLAENVLTANIEYYDYLTVNRDIEGNTIYPNNYEYSKIRAYLNGSSYITKSSNRDLQVLNTVFKDTGFLQTAFTNVAQNKIVKISLDNSPESTNPYENSTLWNKGINSFSCNTTSDKIFLLSVQDITNNKFNFDTYQTNGVGNARIRVATDFARANGAFDRSASLVKQRNPEVGGGWSLRSPRHSNGDSSSYIYCNGSVIFGDTDYSVGVVPALCVE
ncbi:MAG: FMN-binding protein [Spirochaetaceae bacterium]|nr:FMN-binding protein [Spirochaetaceae bacterium]